MKGSFGHQNNYNGIYISKTPKISKFYILLQWFQTTVKHIILSKPQMFLYKFIDKYEVYCHGNICASASPTSFKAWYVILKACKKMEYVDLCYLLSLCNNIHIKVLGTQNI